MKATINLARLSKPAHSQEEQERKKKKYLNQVRKKEKLHLSIITFAYWIQKQDQTFCSL
jgi:hypothetical protein